MEHKRQSDKLTERDIAFLPTLARFLRTLKGEARSKTNRQIQAEFPEHFSGISRGTLTGMIAEIRIKKMVKNLIASPNGFYISLDSKRIKEYVETLEGHVSARKKSIKSFGADPGAGVKSRYKVKGYKHPATGKWVKGYYRLYPGFKHGEQLRVDFDPRPQGVSGRKVKVVNRNPSQIKLF